MGTILTQNMDEKLSKEFYFLEGSLIDKTI